MTTTQTGSTWAEIDTEELIYILIETKRDHASRANTHTTGRKRNWAKSVLATKIRMIRAELATRR